MKLKPRRPCRCRQEDSCGSSALQAAVAGAASCDASTLSMALVRGSCVRGGAVVRHLPPKRCGSCAWEPVQLQASVRKFWLAGTLTCWLADKCTSVYRHTNTTGTVWLTKREASQRAQSGTT
jgi:hypothetical protein